MPTRKLCVFLYLSLLKRHPLFQSSLGRYDLKGAKHLHSVQVVLKMSATREELNLIFKTLGKRSKEDERWKEYTENVAFNVLWGFSHILDKTSVERIMFFPCGSAAEDFKCLKTDDVGDVDIMIFPNSDKLVISDECTEYLDKFPLYVRIKGVDHPVLQRCLVGDTDYVPTSALKNFHPVIFGNSAYRLVKFLSSARGFQQTKALNRFSTVLHSTCHFQNNANSPAVTLNFAQSLKDPQYLPNIYASQWEWLIGHSLEAFGIVDTREEADMLNVFSQFANELVMSVSNKSQSFVSKLVSAREFYCSDRGQDLRARFRDIGRRLQMKRRMINACAKVDLQNYLKRVGTQGNSQKEVQSFKRVGGIDLVPAFRSQGWPKVAEEWVKRERKWPSPDIVEKVVHEGFHLVAKPPKNGGNPGRDFRISFSNAEFLLSQEMNAIQRECCRCLKKFHQAYLCTEPKSLVTFHLKNVLLHTIEETGAEIWTENNRSDCMMKLFGNLLEALRKKELRHFFVRSYNLFSEDYIDNPQMLETLAGKVKEIMKNPLQVTKRLILDQDTEDRGPEVQEDEELPDRLPTL